MNKSKFLLVASITLNLIFISIFLSRLRQFELKLVPDGAPEVEITPLITPQVISGKKEVSNVSVKVTKVIDGDTIVLENGETLRYIGIDTPEVSGGRECFADEAAGKNRELVLEREVQLIKDVSETDRYGRLLRYVWVVSESGQESIFVNEFLVREGYASAVTYPPDVRYSELFREAEKEARDNDRGLWEKCGTSVKTDLTSQEESGKGLPGNNNQTSSTVCSGNFYNCRDFLIQKDAQTVFDSCSGTSTDIHKLDSDGDGVACESLP